jgi:hypothetical protein
LGASSTSAQAELGPTGRKPEADRLKGSVARPADNICQSIAMQSSMFHADAQAISN